MNFKYKRLLSGITLLLGANFGYSQSQTATRESTQEEDSTSVTLNFYSDILLTTYFGHKNIDKETFHHWIDTVLPSCSAIAKCHSGDVAQCPKNKESLRGGKQMYTEMVNSLRAHNKKAKENLGSYSGQPWEKSLNHPIEVARMQLNDMCEYSQVEGNTKSQVNFAPTGTDRMVTLDSNLEAFVFRDKAQETAFLAKFQKCDDFKESEYHSLAQTIIWNSLQQKNEGVKEITTRSLPDDFSFDFKDTQKTTVQLDGKTFEVLIPPFSHFMTYISRMKKINNNCKMNTQNAVFNVFFPNLVNEHFMLREFLAPFESIQGLQEAMLTSLSDEEDVPKKTTISDLQEYLNTMPPLQSLLSHYVFLDAWEQERGIFEISGDALINTDDLPTIKARLHFHFESFWNGVHISLTELEDAQKLSLFEAHPIPDEVSSQFYQKIERALKNQMGDTKHKIQRVKDEGAIYITIQQAPGRPFDGSAVQGFLNVLHLKPLPESEL